MIIKQLIQCFIGIEEERHLNHNEGELSAKSSYKANVRLDVPDESLDISNKNVHVSGKDSYSLEKLKFLVGKKVNRLLK